MKRKSIDFRELLERLLPVDQLAAADRRRVERALASGVTAHIEHAGLVALHQLEQLGAIQRVDPSRNGGNGALRFQSRTAIDIISIELPAATHENGVVVHPRLALVPQARAGLDQVRGLLRLDDPMVLSDPRRGSPRLRLIEELDRTGRELTGAAEVCFLPRNDEDGSAETRPFDPELALLASTNPRVVVTCPDTTSIRRLEAEGLRRGMRSIALAGVFSEDGESLGHLEALSPELNAFGPQELSMLALLSDCCASAWERSTRIEKLMFVDPLTGAFNRSYFDRQVLNEMARAQRSLGDDGESTSFALCIADIDNFKAFNTAYGYEAGNQVLLHVAQTLRNGVRPFDTVARWGGEEFAILLTAPVQGEDVVTVCERLRSKVEKQMVAIEALDRHVHRVVVTVSMGVALFPNDEKTSQDLFRAANQALLRAKLPPKNRVVYYRPPGEWKSKPRPA